jgi:galactose-1-phosphate uridylyltransferase
VVELRRAILSGTLRDPRRRFATVETEVEVRWDPLTGHTSRLLEARGLMPADAVDIGRMAEESRAGCPFCRERILEATPELPTDLGLGERLTQGEAVLFPNLHTYGTWSAVTVYSPERHLLPVNDLSASLVADNLRAQVRWARAVMRADPESSWISLNANHLVSSGSSLFHPHMQSLADPVPTTAQRNFADVPADRFIAYLEMERSSGERYLGGGAHTEWLASFAPLGPCELRAFVPAVASPAQLDDEMVEELGRGISAAAALYSDLGYQSFNLAMYGLPAHTEGYPLNLRMVVRSNPTPLYRSDATYLERLHWEGAIDIWPEEVAERARPRFLSLVRQRSGPDSSSAPGLRLFS